MRKPQQSEDIEMPQLLRDSFSRRINHYLSRLPSNGELQRLAFRRLLDSAYVEGYVDGASKVHDG